jgi:dienelactone hydrolase
MGLDSEGAEAPGERPRWLAFAPFLSRAPELSSRQWRVLGMLSVVGLFEQYDVSILAFALPAIQASLAIAEDEVGLLGSIITMGALPAAAVGLAADRLGRRRLLLFTIVSYTLLTGATAFAPDANTFVALQFLARGFSTAEMMLSVVVIAEEFGPRTRGWGIGALDARGAGRSRALLPRDRGTRPRRDRAGTSAGTCAGRGIDRLVVYSRGLRTPSRSAMSRWISRCLAGIGALLGIAWIAAHAHLAGWGVEATRPEALAQKLSPGFEFIAPEGDGPFPTALLFHGCGGLSDGPRNWARQLRSAGWAALILDSLGPRDITGKQVCGGRQLLGRERAGDVLIAIAEARSRKEVDANRLVLVGWSHGGWALIETLAMDPPSELPPNLSSAPDRPLEGVRAVVLFYPYCGIAARTGVWEPEIPALLLLGREDQTALPGPCIAMAEGLRDSGRVAETHVYEGAVHGFDHAGRPGHPNPRYHPQAARQARSALLDFLARYARHSGA